MRIQGKRWGWYAVLGIALLAVIVLFVFLPTGTLDNPRWIPAAQFGATFAAIVALVLSAESVHRLGDQVSADERARLHDEVQELLQAFVPWVSLTVGLHSLTGEWLPIADLWWDREKGSSSRPQTESETDDRLDAAETDPKDYMYTQLLAINDQVEAALERLSSSALALSYMHWRLEGKDGHASPLDLVARIKPSLTSASALQNFERFYSSSASAQSHYAALQWHLMRELRHLGRDPRGAFRSRLSDFTVWAGGAGHTFGDLVRSGRVKGTTSNSFLMGAFLGNLGDGGDSGYLLNATIYLALVYGLWPSKEALRGFLGARFPSLRQRLDDYLPAWDGRAVYGDLIANELEDLIESPYVLCLDVTAYLAAETSNASRK